MAYKHGLYGSLVASDESISTSKTVPIYIGTAPIHRVKKENRVINKPLLIRNPEQAQTKLGYRETDNFDEFTLSAVIFAHFSNNIKPIGPIVVIVLDTITNADNTTSTLEIINGVGTIVDNVIVDSIVITDKILGTDYELKYNESGQLEVSELEDGLGESISISYKKVETSKIKPENVIGSYEEETETRTGYKRYKMFMKN